ncbi:type II secretion system protein [Fibrobacter sp. UWOV1]|uniref:type II secretion system protein n=1 Tax=Fibrobacter sp. UWOV1 TaxID=1896215 RepID=UPI001587AC00|nr:prepilin-type N-terminal cleavage/methylation domain-containing protein [Fibrobacter sp. UWOV1]
MQKFSAKNRKTAIFWHMKGKFHLKHGFTMIEIMVVIVVLGVIAGIGAPKLLGYTERVKEKADMMKLYYLRDALNRALIESEVALYQSDFVTKGDKANDNLKKLKDKLASESGLDLFVIEMHPNREQNIQHNHPSINSGSEMSKIIGSTGVWYDALRDAGFEGVADIVALRNGTVKGSLNKDGETYRAYSYTDDNGQTQYRTTPKNPIFMSKLLNRGKNDDLKNITSQGSNKTNYRLTLNFQWTGGDESSHSVEVALLPAGAKMRKKSNKKGGAIMSDNGVCFSTYGDIGCAEYRY